MENNWNDISEWILSEINVPYRINKNKMNENNEIINCECLRSCWKEMKEHGRTHKIPVNLR